MIIDLKTILWKIERRWMLLPWRWAAGWAIQGAGGAACLFGGLITERNALAGFLAAIAGVMLFLTGYACRSAE